MYDLHCGGVPVIDPVEPDKCEDGDEECCEEGTVDCCDGVKCKVPEPCVGDDCPDDTKPDPTDGDGDIPDDDEPDLPIIIVTDSKEKGFFEKTGTWVVIGIIIVVVSLGGFVTYQVLKRNQSKKRLRVHAVKLDTEG